MQIRLVPSVSVMFAMSLKFLTQGWLMSQDIVVAVANIVDFVNNTDFLKSLWTCAI